MTSRIPVTGQLPDDMVSGPAGWRSLGAGALKRFLNGARGLFKIFFMWDSGTDRSRPLIRCVSTSGLTGDRRLRPVLLVRVRHALVVNSGACFSRVEPKIRPPERPQDFLSSFFKRSFLSSDRLFRRVVSLTRPLPATTRRSRPGSRSKESRHGQIQKTSGSARSFQRSG